MAAKPRAVFIIGVIAVVIAGAASFYLMQYLKGQEKKVVEALATEKVLVAAIVIPMGKTIEDKELKLIEWPKASVPEGIMRSASEAVGRVPLLKIHPGDPLTSAKLMPIGGPPGMLSYKIPEGHRAMTVGVNKVSGVAGFIAPGNKVDVVLVSAAGKKDKELMSKIILQNVPILATGTLIDQAPDGKPVEVPTVTMDLSPEDSERLALATSKGKLQLLLKKAGDTDEVMTAGVRVTEIWAESGKAKRAKVVKKRVAGVAKKRVAKKRVKRPRYVKPKVEVYRNGDKAIETFRVKEEAL
jgi:pilus assembly protein CpaB